MSLIRFFKIWSSNFKYILFFSAIASTLVFFLTQNDKKQFTSKTIINTGVVSGYNIENHNSDSKVDRDFTRNEIENLINVASANETVEELSIQLLANYLHLERIDPEWIDTEGYAELNDLFSDKLSRNLLIDSTTESTIVKLKQLRDTEGYLELRTLIYSDHPYFGVNHLSGIKIGRKGASDLLEFSYTTSNPAICMQTLKILTKIFFEKHRLLKEGQSENVLEFFEMATKESKMRLSVAENNLLLFREKNNIINYYEQTRFIADKKETLDELIFKEKMELEGARSSINRLNVQLQNRGVLAELNASILSQRDQISSLTNKLALIEFKESYDSEDLKKMKEWKNELALLEQDVSAYTLKTYNAKYSPEGLYSDELLSNWLSKLIQIETSGSKLEVLETRKKEFKKIYAQFAPWGSKLKKIEREIALAEDAYLENLHSFNQARLHLQNTLISSNLGVLDAPFYPVKDNGSKRPILVIIAFLSGGLITLGVLVLFELLDQTLKSPSRAAEVIGIPLVGILPKFPIKNTRFANPSHINFLALRKRAVELTFQRLYVNLKKQQEGPKIIAISSMKRQEGVTYFANLLSDRFRKDFTQVLRIIPEREDINASLKDQDFIKYDMYSFKESYSTTFEWVESLSDKPMRDKYDVIIIEIPALLNGEFPLNLISQKINFIQVTRANRTWNMADENMLETIKDATTSNPLLVLNGVGLDYMEEFIGDIPKPRSRIRLLLKQMASFNFSGKTSI